MRIAAPMLMYMHPSLGRLNDHVPKEAVGHASQGGANDQRRILIRARPPARPWLSLKVAPSRALRRRWSRGGPARRPRSRSGLTAMHPVAAWTLHDEADPPPPESVRLPVQIATFQVI